MQDVLKNCQLCPRKCGVNRKIRYGFCNALDKLKIAKVMLHKFEEPCISHNKGSGAIFFSGCNLQCCYCQNYKISCQNFGKEISIKRLVQIFKKLESDGADNINLVTGTHFIVQIKKALKLAKIKIPVIFNCGGYESVDSLKMLEGLVDIYIPDFKYSLPNVAKKYSNAEDYPQKAILAICEMQRQVGCPKFSEGGKLLKGVIVRHLVLPENTENSLGVLGTIEKTFKKNEVLISLMSQYTPFYNSCNFKELSRRLKPIEYKIVLKKFKEMNFEGYMQELSSAKEEYTPVFDCEGV